MSKNKTFIIDTNVILLDHQCILKFDGNDIIIPFVVLEEVDNFKTKNTSLGFSAREFGRILDNLRQKGSLQKGVELPTGGQIKVVKNKVEGVDFIVDGHKNDHVLLKTAINLDKEIDNLVLITKDTLLRIQADGVGIRSEDYKNTKVVKQDIFDKIPEVYTSSENMDKLFSTKILNLEDVNFSDPFNFQYFILKNEQNSSQSALAKISSAGISLVDKQEAWGVSPKNKEQQFAMDALLDPEKKLVVLSGPAGVGKTLLSLASGLEQAAELGGFYEGVLISKPVISVGKELGYLPGTMREKMDPWLAPFYDNFSYLMKNAPKKMQGASGFAQMEDFDHIEVQALSFVRGRSISNKFILLDECQNLSPLEIKTFITRAGEGSKIVLLGDPYQIDNTYLDTYSNGLSYVIDKFEGQNIFAHVHMTKGERSDLAELGAKLL